MGRMRALPVLLLLLFALPQCGSGTGAEPRSAANHQGDSESDGDSDGESSESGADDDDAPAGRADDKPRGPNCDDGSCSLCGSGICPSGWYCDENASGGAACSWLTECADKPTCGCITRVLGSSCKCREEGGGLKVSCG
jgi:hypothetical protein